MARLIVLLFLSTLLGGCATTQRALMPTPHLYSTGKETVFGDLNPKLQSNTATLLYVTDRVPETAEDGALHYGFGRSHSLAVGEATVSLGDTDWAGLAASSSTARRPQPLYLRMGPITELARFPPTPWPYEVQGGAIAWDPGIGAKVLEIKKVVEDLIAKRLALTSRKEAFIFVHGYNNTFEDAAFTLAELWHFMGREGVPFLYTWPAGHGGVTGYTYDRESGEFTVFHLKNAIRFIASLEQIEGINILAHSRGTDVAATALRELFIEARAAGADPAAVYKLKHLVLAAPDLDLNVLRQRVMTEPIAPGAESVTVYASPNDKAIGISQWLFGDLRLGRVEAAELSETERTVLKKQTNTSIVQFLGEGGSFGHGYFHSDPAASSDLILVMRYGRRPGAENGRPLKSLQEGFWLLEDNYLLSP